MKALLCFYLEVMTNVNLKKNRTNVEVKRFNINRKISSLEIFMRNMESLISKIFNGKKKTVEKLLHCSKVQTPRSWSHGKNIPMEWSYHKEYSY